MGGAAGLPSLLGPPGEAAAAAGGGLVTCWAVAVLEPLLPPKYCPNTICFLPAEFMSSSMAALPSAVRRAMSSAAGVDLRLPARTRVFEH